MLPEEAVVSLASNAAQGSESAFAPKWELGGEDQNGVNRGTRGREKRGGSTRRGGGPRGQKARGARWALSRLHFPEVTLPAMERRRTGTEGTWTGAELDISSSWTAYTSPAIHRGYALINKA